MKNRHNQIPYNLNINMTKIALESQIKQCGSIYTSSIDNEAVMLNVDLGKYFGMNSIASDIWNKLKNTMSVESLIHSLSNEYNVSPEECQADVIPFLENLISNGLIEVDSPVYANN